MVSWARENARSSGLEDAPIRWIVDDCTKFVEREIRRGRQYDAIIMDPPSYGRGPTGEVWRLEENLYPFVELVRGVLSDQPLFVILNSYTTGLAPSVVTYILETLISKRFGGHTVSGELGLPELQPAEGVKNTYYHGFTAQELDSIVRGNGCTVLYIQTLDDIFVQSYADLFTDKLAAAQSGETLLYRVTDAGFAPMPMEVSAQ